VPRNGRLASSAEGKACSVFPVAIPLSSIDLAAQEDPSSGRLEVPEGKGRERFE